MGSLAGEAGAPPHSMHRSGADRRRPVNLPPGGARQALILGRLQVLAGYGVIFALLSYVLTFGASAIVAVVREGCAARGSAAVDSLLYGMGGSPVCGDGIAGQVLALLPPLLELPLALLLIRGPRRVSGQALPAPVEAVVRAVFAPAVPAMAALRLAAWPEKTRITADGILFEPALVREFQAWDQGRPAVPSRLTAHHALFTTLHELGHLSLYDVLYSRAADRAIPVLSVFVAVLLLVALPAGQLVSGYWLSVLLTGLECLGAALATRLVLGGITSNFEFPADRFAASRVAEMEGRRRSLPAMLKDDPRSWLNRSHPRLTARREYLRSMSCGDFLWSYLLAVPLVALVQTAATTSRETIAAIHVLLAANDLLVAGSLFLMGVFGGAAASRGYGRVWALYGAVVAVTAGLVVLAAVFGPPPALADSAARLTAHGRAALWPLILAAPVAGVLARRWTVWFEAGLDTPRTPAAAGVGPLAAPRSGWRRWLGLPGWRRPVQGFYRAFVAVAAAEAGVFGFIVLFYLVETGVRTVFDLFLFGLYFAIPLSHAMRPLARWPLVLDQLLQTFFLSATVVMMGVVNFLLGPPGTPGRDAAGLRLRDDPEAVMTRLTDGTFLREYGPAMFRDVLWLCMLLLAVGVLRWTGQSLERKKGTTIHEHA